MKTQSGIELTLPDVYADVEVDEPEMLIILKLPERVTAKRAPGTGPLLLSGLVPIADRFLAARMFAFNTDIGKNT
eukprot:2865234-Amphidinium_carterae.1